MGVETRTQSLSIRLQELSPAGSVRGLLVLIQSSGTVRDLPDVRWPSFDLDQLLVNCSGLLTAGHALGVETNLFTLQHKFHLNGQCHSVDRLPLRGVAGQQTWLRTSTPLPMAQTPGWFRRRRTTYSPCILREWRPACLVSTLSMLAGLATATVQAQRLPPAPCSHLLLPAD